ncbi:MAG: hypothetical protein P4L53_00480 [Candidatus Obscuribacterales bacterium]|nr:hypothetical protein [Candidatus Obscuribacterales bacterium]
MRLLLCMVLTATSLSVSAAGAAPSVKPEGAAASSAKSRPKTGQGPKKAIENSVSFVVLSQQADREVHAKQLDKAKKTAEEIAKLANAEPEAETKGRIEAEVHQIRAEIAILQADWGLAEQELMAVKKISSSFAGNEGTGHFDDLITLIRQRQGKLHFGPKEAPEIDAELAVKTQLRALQVAIEEYAREHKDQYPTKIAQLTRGYLDKYGGHFTNPFTKKAELPQQLANSESLENDTNLGKGKLYYQLTDEGQNYMIFAGGFDGKPIMLENAKPFILRAEDAPVEPIFHTENNHPHID